LELKDIKPILEIESEPFFIDHFWLIFFLVLMMVAVFLIYKRGSKNRDKNNLLSLKNINLDNQKSASYRLTLEGKKFVTPQNRHIYTEMTKLLERYKYKKDVPPFSGDTIASIKAFLDSIDG